MQDNRTGVWHLGRDNTSSKKTPNRTKPYRTSPDWLTKLQEKDSTHNDEVNGQRDRGNRGNKNGKTWGAWGAEPQPTLTQRFDNLGNSVGGPKNPGMLVLRIQKIWKGQSGYVYLFYLNLLGALHRCGHSPRLIAGIRMLVLYGFSNAVQPFSASVYHFNRIFVHMSTSLDGVLVARLFIYARSFIFITGPENPERVSSFPQLFCAHVRRLLPIACLGVMISTARPLKSTSNEMQWMGIPKTSFYTQHMQNATMRQRPAWLFEVFFIGSAFHQPKSNSRNHQDLRS